MGNHLKMADKQRILALLELGCQIRLTTRDGQQKTGLLPGPFPYGRRHKCIPTCRSLNRLGLIS